MVGATDVERAQAGFRFSLTPMEQILPRGQWDPALRWFGLTDGFYWIEPWEHELLRYLPQALVRRYADSSRARHPYVDYYVARLWEDIISLMRRRRLRTELANRAAWLSKRLRGTGNRPGRGPCTAVSPDMVPVVSRKIRRPVRVSARMPMARKKALPRRGQMVDEIAPGFLPFLRAFPEAPA